MGTHRTEDYDRRTPENTRTHHIRIAHHSALEYPQDDTGRRAPGVHMEVYETMKGHRVLQTTLC